MKIKFKNKLSLYMVFNFFLKYIFLEFLSFSDLRFFEKFYGEYLLKFQKENKKSCLILIKFPIFFNADMKEKYV